MRLLIRLAALFSATALATAITVVAFAPAAHAATLTVTTASDLVNGGDGLLSLREAISEANAAGSATTIVLSPVTYQLTLCSSDEDANAGGDLDHVVAHDLTVEGNGATIEQTCDDERILHGTGDTSTISLEALTLTGGEGEGAAVHVNGALEVTDATVTGNDGDSAIYLDGMTSASLVLTDSTVGPNTGHGVRGPFGANVTVTDSTVSNNTGGGVYLQDGHLDVSGSTVTDNGSYGLHTTGHGSGSFPLVDTVVSGNGDTGVTCSNCGDLDIVDSVVASNSGGGINYSVDQDEPTDEVSLTIVRSSVLENTRSGPGAGLRVTITELVESAPTAQIVVDRSTFAGNAASGASGTGGAIYAAVGDVRLTNSTVSGNTASVSGGAIYAVDDVQVEHTTTVYLAHATVASNSGDQIVTEADLHAFGSIVSAAVGGGDCAIGGSTVSGGYNVGGDGTCGFTGTGDQNTAGAINLGPPAANGGPTLTRLPLAGSPALGAVPSSACTVSTVDQRGFTRPGGAACEAGAVEADGLSSTGSKLTPILIAGGALLGVGLLLLVVLAVLRRRPTT